jgi:hypothetical protein
MDLHHALDQGIVTLALPRGQRPDYLARCLDETLVVIESKGSQGDPSYTRNQQIRRGCEQAAQVLATAFGGSIKHRVVIGSSFALEDVGRSSKLYVGDPDVVSPKEIEPLVSGDAAIWMSHVARIAALSGDESLARAFTKAPTEEDGESTLDRRSSDGREYLGRQLVIEAQSGSATVFIGIEAGLRETLIETTWSGMTRERSAELLSFLDTSRRHPSSIVVTEQVVPKTPTKFRATSEDGVLLQVELDRAPEA